MSKLHIVKSSDSGIVSHSCLALLHSLIHLFKWHANRSLRCGFEHKTYLYLTLMRIQMFSRCCFMG